MAEHRDARLEPGLAFDVRRQQVADAALGEADVPERVLVALAPTVPIELRDVRPFGHDDDAEEPALSAAPVEMRGDLGQADRELGNDDQVGAAGDAAHE